MMKYAPKACNFTNEILALCTINITSQCFKSYDMPSFIRSFVFRAPCVQLTAFGVFPLSEMLRFVYSASKMHAKPRRESRLPRAQSKSDKRDLRMPSAWARMVL